MEFKFDANQQFQTDAIEAVADLFEGQPRIEHEHALERVHKPPSSQVSFSTQRGPHRWLRGPPEDAPATLVRLLTLRNGAGAGAERRVTAGGRRIVCGWHQRILGSIKT